MKDMKSQKANPGTWGTWGDFFNNFHFIELEYFLSFISNDRHH